MPFFIEQEEVVRSYRVEGFFSYQDLGELIEDFDRSIDEDPNSRFLMDFSKQTGLEESVIKKAFSRIEKGVPRTVRIAIVYQQNQSMFRHLLEFILNSIPDTARFFENRDKAIEWLVR